MPVGVPKHPVERRALVTPLRTADPEILIDLGNRPSATLGDQDDKLQIVTLGLTYDITRIIQFGCTYAHENRDVSGNTVFSYKDNTFGCSAQIMLR